MRYLEDRGDQLVVRPCAEDALGRGARWAFVVAPLVLLTASAAAWIGAAGETTSFLIGWGAGAAIASVIALVGLVTMARGRVVRGVVRIDLAERLIERPGRPMSVLRGVRAVRIRAGRAPWSGFALTLVYADARSELLLRVPRAQGRALSETANALADALDARAEVPASARRSRPLVPNDPRLAAALANAPLDGLFLAASFWYLMSSRDPFVRFHAKQSLALFGLSTTLALFSMSCCGLPLSLFAPPGLVAFASAVPLVALTLTRIGVRTVAATRAHRGELWIQPWLAPLSRRWAPAER